MDTQQMDQRRQQAFQKLRPVCVELSSVALQFNGRHATSKDVLQALERQHEVLATVGGQSQLDEKLAEYAFFPLSHVFNESQRLSPRCMQVAIDTVTILVSQGWRQRLAPEMGKQLLILLTLIAGGDPRRQNEPPTDELKGSGYKCIETIIYWLAQSATGRAVFNNQGARNIVDQLAYLLVDALTSEASDGVQIAASEVLLELYKAISNRVVLATLLPRTVSSLTKALRPNTQSRRTRSVLATNLKLLGAVLKLTISDDVQHRDDQEQSEKEALGESWLEATTPQIKKALVQVCKLRSHDHLDVRNALYDLCVMLVENNSITLKESLSILTETLVMLARSTDDPSRNSKLKALMLIHPELTSIMQSSFYDWSQSLPRVMQGSDDAPKVLMLTKITNALDLLSETALNPDSLTSTLSTTLLRSIANVVDLDEAKQIQIYSDDHTRYMSLIQRNMAHDERIFEPILFNHQSQRSSGSEMQRLFTVLRKHPLGWRIARNVVNAISDFASDQKTAPIWVALQLLHQGTGPELQIDDILELTDLSDNQETSRAFLIEDLYTQTKDLLLQSSPYSTAEVLDHRNVALALEAVALQGQQLGRAYRTELYETLYPILALLSSKNGFMQTHAITTLNCLASSCEYDSVSALLIENADYLVNSIAWKLNTFNLSPEAPAVLNMVLRLVGANMMPHLDDLITSIFAALDSFHGYPQWVEMLFGVLQTMVDESARKPELAITDGRDNIANKRAMYPVATVNSIIDDLRLRKRRKLESGTSTHTNHHEKESAPHRPWTKQQDDPNYTPDPTEGKDIETLLREAEAADEENELPPPKQPEEEDPTKPLSKTHDLLLKIAQATVPHLSSPSPRVRQILLQLLGQISPLLARHENSFLPLINSVWPGLVQRLFTDMNIPACDTTPQSLGGETAYNIAAAADVIASLCENAGDFMTTRIEQIFIQLKNMYSKLYKDFESQLSRHGKGGGNQVTVSDTKGSAIRGVVDLQVIKTDSSTSLVKEPTKSASNTALFPLSRTSNGQIFHSFVRLMVAVINHVSLNGEHADIIFNMLAPLMDYPGPVGETVSEALQLYNADAVWATECRKVGEEEIQRGLRAVDDRVWRGVETPKLSGILEKSGIQLQPMVF